jgi:hypothetical protein
MANKVRYRYFLTADIDGTAGLDVLRRPRRRRRWSGTQRRRLASRRVPTRYVGDIHDTVQACRSLLTLEVLHWIREYLQVNGYEQVGRHCLTEPRVQGSFDEQLVHLLSTALTMYGSPRLLHAARGSSVSIQNFLRTNAARRQFAWK